MENMNSRSYLENMKYKFHIIIIIIIIIRYYFLFIFIFPLMSIFVYFSHTHIYYIIIRIKVFENLRNLNFAPSVPLQCKLLCIIKKICFKILIVSYNLNFYFYF